MPLDDITVYDLKTETVITSSLSTSTIFFGSKTGQASATPDPISMPALSSYLGTYYGIAVGLGGDPTGATSSVAAFNAAVAVIQARAVASGVINAPAGQYYFPTGITVPAGVVVRGEGQNATVFFAWHTDVKVVTTTGGKGGLENLSIYGKGTNNDTGTFGATQNALQINGTAGHYTNVLVWGGYHPIEITGIDNILIGVYASEAYGPAVCHITGASWFIRCSWDHNPSNIAIRVPAPTYAAWQAGHAYTGGDAVTHPDGYVIACVTPAYPTTGLSGGSAPTLKNYGINFADNAVTWCTVAPAPLAACWLSGGALENHFQQTDFSGYFSTSILCNAVSAIVVAEGCVCSSPISVLKASAFSMDTTELGGDVTADAAMGGRFFLGGSFASGGTVAPVNVTLGGGLTDFAVTDNWLGGGTITTSGASDYYKIVAHPRDVVVDGASGTNKTVIYKDAKFQTSVTVPSVYGGAAAGASLILKGTSHATPSGDYAEIWGSTITLRAKSGSVSNVLIGVSGATQGRVTLAGSASGSQTWQPAAAASGTITWPAGIVDFSATGGASQVVKQTSAGAIFTVGQLASSDLSDVTSLVTLTGAQELTNKTLTSSVGKGTWTASGTWTLPALTLGGVVSGGGQQLNNIIIGTATPLAGAFTSLAASSSIKSSSPSAGVGYATGAGGAVTQITNRATAVTLNAICGAITLVSAAGSATPSSFSVANSSVAATDTPYVCQKSGADRYEIFVTNVQAGQFDITSFTTGGTTTEQPVFNFTVIKAVAS